MFEELVGALADLNREAAIDQVRKLLEAGANPFDIVEKGVMRGMDIVGEKFSTGEYFLPDLLRAAKAVEACSAIVKPLLQGDQGNSRGTVVIGTVAGDIHDLGKNIVIATWESAGFKVVDLGVNVPLETFIQAVRSEKPFALGLCALLTVTMVQMGKVIEALRKEPELSHVKVIIGGAPIDQEFAMSIGADAYGEDAHGALVKIRELREQASGGMR